MIIVSRYSDGDEVKKVKETNVENYKNSAIYIILVLILSIGGTVLEKEIMKKYISKKIEELEKKLKPIDKEKLETAKIILNIKKENLNILSSNSNDSDIMIPKTYTYKPKNFK